MNPHTPPALPRRLRLIGKLPCATFLLALCTLIAVTPAAAQNNDHNRAHAVLHLQAQIVPVAYPPSARTYDSAAGGAVIYSLPSGQLAMTVVEEIHVVTGTDAIAWLRDRPMQAVILKTLTVVPR